MELTNSFVVPVSPDVLWGVLTDVERIAPCIPGFTLAEVDGSTSRGRMKVKVGAISVHYEVEIAFVERDDAAKRAVLAIAGRENRGSGSVNASVTATLSEQGAGTHAAMVTDVQVTGRVAQFGRGIMADVSSRVVEQFVACLNDRVLGSGSATTPSASPPVQESGAAERAAGSVPPREAAALDLGAAAALPVLKRIAPFLLAFAVGRLSTRSRRRRT
jgi:uncharacterized protein